MTLASDLRQIVTAARPTVEEWLDIGEQFVGFRDACKAKGLDWGQIKALIKAQILDERDGGRRVEKIVEKADFASSYAAMLGLLPGKMNDENFSDESLGLRGDAPAVTADGTPKPPSGAKEAGGTHSISVGSHAPAGTAVPGRGSDTAERADSADGMNALAGASATGESPGIATVTNPASDPTVAARTNSTPAPDPSSPAPGAETPRAGTREQPARGDIDLTIQNFLDRSNPNCIANRAQGRG